MLPLFYLFYISRADIQYFYTLLVEYLPSCCPHGEILLQHIQNEVKNVFLMIGREKHNLNFSYTLGVPVII
jgi:hypothetical protein